MIYLIFLRCFAQCYLGQAENSHERNRFLPITHEAFPSCLAWWDKPCVQLQELQRVCGQSLLGHSLPDPSLFLTANNEVKPGRVLMWLCLRPLFLWRLGSPNAKLYVNKDWRAMLEVAEDLGALKENQLPKSKRRIQMSNHLHDLMNGSHSTGMSLHENNLITGPALWNGVELHVDGSGRLSPQIVQEIIWELYEAKFRLEMFMIDRKMVPEPLGHDDQAKMAQEIWYERELLVHRCWPGQAHHPSHQNPGFSQHHSHSSHIPFVKALFNLVQGWPGPKPAELREPFPAEDDLTVIWAVEEIVAAYYIRVFTKFFQRPPTLPHAAS